MTTDSVPAPMVLPRTPGSVVEATHRDQRGLWMLTPLRDWVMSDINNTAVLAATEGLTVHRVLFDAATPAASVPTDAEDAECLKRARERGHPDDCGCDWCCFGTVNPAAKGEAVEQTIAAFQADCAHLRHMTVTRNGLTKWVCQNCGTESLAASVPAADKLETLRDENASLLAQVERLQARLIKAEEPRPTQPIDDFGGNIRSMYIRVSEGWLRRFDKWRKTKGLSRSGAIRKLVQDAWEADQ